MGRTSGRARLSAGFLCALAGIGLTLLGWYGPWLWPGWPGIFMAETIFSGGRDFSDLSFAMRAAVFTGLIVLNVTTWALLLRGLIGLIRALLTRRSRDQAGG